MRRFAIRAPAARAEIILVRESATCFNYVGEANIEWRYKYHASYSYIHRRIATPACLPSQSRERVV